MKINDPILAFVWDNNVGHKNWAYLSIDAEWSESSCENRSGSSSDCNIQLLSEYRTESNLSDSDESRHFWFRLRDSMRCGSCCWILRYRINIEMCSKSYFCIDYHHLHACPTVLVASLLWFLLFFIFWEWPQKSHLTLSFPWGTDDVSASLHLCTRSITLL